MTNFDFQPENNQLELEIAELIKQIVPLDDQLILEARRYSDSLAKPLGSLGRMEQIRERMWAITQGNLQTLKKAVVVYAGDNGVCAQGVSSNPQDVTWKVCQSILTG